MKKLLIIFLLFFIIFLNCSFTNVTTNSLTFEQYLKECWNRKEEKIDVKKFNLKEEEITSIIYKIHREEPKYYYIFLNHMCIDENKDNIVDYYIQEYELDRSSELQDEWEILNDKLVLCKTDLEKVLIVHDHIIENTMYSEDGSPLYHNIEGAILEKKAVCEGYALAFKYYMNKLNIPCNVVSGIIIDGSVPHAWNQVKINNNWYFIDTTYDDSRNPKVTKHDYFLISENKMRQTHYWERNEFEYCNDITYDDYFWTLVKDEMCAYNGKLYYEGYVHTPQFFESGIFEYDLETNKRTRIFEHSESWPDKDNPSQRLYTLNQIAIYKDEIYISLPKSVVKIPVPNTNSLDFKVFNPTTSKTVFKLEPNSNEYIYDINIKNGRLYYDASNVEVGIREYKSIVIDPTFIKKDLPFNINKTSFNLVLGQPIQQIETGCPLPVKYKSLDETILKTRINYNDTFCDLIPIKDGKTSVEIEFLESDRYKAFKQIIDVTICKNNVDLYTAQDEIKILNNNVKFTGDLYISRNGSGDINPSNKIEIFIKGDNNIIESTRQTIILDGSGHHKYDIETSNNYKNYELIINYLGDDNFNKQTYSKSYSLPHEHIYEEVINDKYLKENATCTHGNIYYKSCSCGHISNITFDDNKLIDHNYNVNFDFNEIDKSCNATFTCTNCNHIINKNCVVNVIKDSNSTCTTNGETIYNVTINFNNKEFKKEFIITKELDSNNHKFNNGKCDECNKIDPNYKQTNYILIIIISLFIPVLAIIIFKLIKRK